MAKQIIINSYFFQHALSHTLSFSLPLSTFSFKQRVAGLQAATVCATEQCNNLRTPQYAAAAHRWQRLRKHKTCAQGKKLYMKQLN